MLLEWIDVKHSNWDEDIEMVRKVYTAITSSDLYADYISGAIDDRIKKKGYLLDVTAIVAVEANVTHYSHEQKHKNAF